MGLLLAALTAALYALTVVIARLAGDTVERTRGLLLSITANALFNLVFIAGRAAMPEPFGFSWSGLVAFGLAGLFTTLIGRWLWFHSVEAIGPSRASAFKNAQPLFTVAFALLFLHERVGLLGLTGAALVVGAVVLIGQEQKSGSPGGITPSGVWWGLAAACSFAVGNTLRKVGITIWPEAALGALVGSIFAAAGMWLAPGSWARGRLLLRTRWGAGDLLYAGTGVLTAFAQQTLFQSLKRAPVWQVNSVVALEPILALLFARVLLGTRERVTARLLVAIALVFGGLVLLALV